MIRTFDRDRLIWDSALESREKFVLLAMALYENSKTGTCWPGLKRLATQTGLSEKSIRRAIKNLEQLSVIEVTKRTAKSGQWASNEYRINLESVKDLPAVRLTDGQSDQRSICPEPAVNLSRTSGQSDRLTYLKELTEENSYSKELDFSSELDPDNPVGQDPGKEDPAPPPPAPSVWSGRDLVAEARKLKAMEVRTFSTDKPVRSGKDWLYKWNINKDPRQIDPEFIAYLVEKQPSWIHINFEQRKKLDEETAIAHCRKLIDPSKREKFEPDLMEAWDKFTTERDAIAARAEAKRKAIVKNDPANNVAYKRFSEALDKTGKLRAVVQSFDHFGLRIAIERDGKTLVSSHTFGRMSLTLLFVELRKVDKRWKTEEALADRLGLRDFFEMCSFEAVA